MATTGGWSETVAGLRIRLEAPDGPVLAGASARLGLCFSNVSDAPLRLYFLQGEHFRAFQSRLVPLDPETGGPLAPPSVPGGHGYVVTEEDFHLLAPGEGRKFAQDLVLPERTGRILVEWTYENEIARWPGGVRTLEGRTRRLFGGKRIPHIWLGTLSATTVLEVVA
jgi:hypothetical protein